jgi:hypothetical protein
MWAKIVVIDKHQEMSHIYKHSVWKNLVICQKSGVRAVILVAA